MDIIKAIEHEQLKDTIPDLKVGNTVKVHARIKEGNKERIQVFEGIIIKVQGKGVNKSFTVRKISYGVGVEKTFLVHSPLVEKVELVRVGKARRARLFYLRDRIGKAAKTKEMLGARIENKEIQIKGKAEVPVEGEAEPEVEPEVEAVVEEAKADVKPAEEAPVKEEKIVEAKNEEKEVKSKTTAEDTVDKKAETEKQETKSEEKQEEKAEAKPAKEQEVSVKEEKTEEVKDEEKAEAKKEDK